MLCAPFQCDECWFLNLKGREVREGSAGDERLLAYIRRVNLDVMWSREGSTVYNTLSNLRKGKRMSEDLGLKPVSIKLGPWPLADTQGFQVAIEMVRASQEAGKNAAAYVQFDTIRKVRAGYANTYDNSASSCQETVFFRGLAGRNSTLTRSNTDSRLFQMFAKGCEKRMGRLVYQELGLSFDVLQEVLKGFEQELWDPKVPRERKRLLVVAGAAFVILFGGALRGGEVLLLEASELVRRIRDGRDIAIHPHVVIPLMGRFKGETGERNVLLVLANESANGLEMRKWVERLAMVLTKEGRMQTVGPAICNTNGFVMERGRLNALLHEALGKIQSEGDMLIGAGVKIEDKFSIHRSFRRGATTRAKELEVPESTINMNNRWRKVESRSGNLPNLPMSDLYVEISQALASKLRFSRSL